MGFITFASILSKIWEHMFNIDPKKFPIFMCCMFIMLINIYVLVVYSVAQQFMHFKLRHFIPINIHDMMRIGSVGIGHNTI